MSAMGDFATVRFRRDNRGARTLNLRHGLAVSRPSASGAPSAGNSAIQRPPSHPGCIPLPLITSAATGLSRCATNARATSGALALAATARSYTTSR